jgi:hypothetical protein
MIIHSKLSTLILAYKINFFFFNFYHEKKRILLFLSKPNLYLKKNDEKLFFLNLH